MTQQTSPQILQRIVGAARGRRFDEAAQLAAQAMADHPQDYRLTALAGAIAFQHGAFDQAVPLLERAQRHYPGDFTIRGNLAESLYHTAGPAPALALCDETSVAADPSMRLLKLAAFFAQECEDHGRAAELYTRVVAANGDDWSSWNNLGNALGGAGRYDEAVAALRKAAGLAADSAPIRINLANALLAAGEFDEGERLLKQAAETEPQDPAPLLALFALHRDQGREDESYQAIAEAARRAPDQAPIRSDYGQEAAKRHDYDIAERELEAALALNPALGPSFVGLGSLYERMNREDELDPLLARAKANATDSQSAAYLEALLHKRSGDIDAAFAALEASGDVVVPGRKFHLRGTMLDRLKRHDEAFEAFVAMNNHWLEDPSQPKLRAQQYRSQVARDTALIEPEWIAGWSPPPAADGRAAPIFLVGFPRSGTTLLDTMLMREPRALVLEEEPILAKLEIQLGGIEALPSLSQQELQDGRDFYFNEVAALGELRPDTIVVDKHPLHLNKVAVIQRFFPDARYIVALRHPCDVVLSCFLTNFSVNDAMANFLDLDDAADLYDLTFAHWAKASQAFGVPATTVVYERLIADTDRELRPLFDWLQLDWPGDDHDHRAAARARGVVYTASYAQVTEPIYQRAAGRWLRYVEQLGPVLERLRPWVERFGYSLDDARIPPWPSP